MALKGGPQGIRSNNVNPGVIKTPMSLGDGEEGRAPFAGRATLKRLGEPEEVRFSTGQSILVDGGSSIPSRLWRDIMNETTRETLRNTGAGRGLGRGLASLARR